MSLRDIKIYFAPISVTNCICIFVVYVTAVVVRAFWLNWQAVILTTDFMLSKNNSRNYF